MTPFQISQDVLPKRDESVRPAATEGWELLFQSPGRRLRLRIGLLQRDSGGPAGDELVRTCRTLLERQRVQIRAHRQPDHGSGWHIKAFRQHANDRVGAVVQCELLSEDAGGASEPFLPELESNERNRRRLRLVVGLRNRATKKR